MVIYSWSKFGEFLSEFGVFFLKYPRWSEFGEFLSEFNVFLSFGSLWGKCFPKYFSKSTEGLSNIEVSELIRLSRLSRGSPGSCGSGVSKRAPDPTFHTRRGSG